MDKYSVTHLKNSFATIDVIMDTLAIQLELEKVQDLKWASTGTESEPCLTIFVGDQTTWFIQPNGLNSGSLTSWFGKPVQVIAANGSKRENSLISVLIRVNQAGVEVAIISLQALSMSSILLKARIKLAEST